MNPQKMAEFLRSAASRAKGASAAVGGGGGGPSGSQINAFSALAVGAFGCYGLYHSVVTVRPGHLGIVYSRFGLTGAGGIQEQALCREGMNFVIPWFQRPVIFDVRTRPEQLRTHTGSKDLQMVEISIRVLYRPDPTKLPFIYRRLGLDFAERVLPSIVNEVAKAVVAQYNASELLTRRDVVSKKISDQLMRRADEFHILLEDVSITHLAFSKEYTSAVEAKQVAQQDAERSKYIVEKAIQEKSQIVIRAQGEAQAAELIGQAIRDNPAFVQLRRIDAAREVANTISTSQNKVYLNADSLLLNHLATSSDEQLKEQSNKRNSSGSIFKSFFG